MSVGHYNGRATQAVDKNPGKTAIATFVCDVGAISMEKITKWMAGKLRIIILLQFELISFRFAYVKDRNLTFP